MKIRSMDKRRRRKKKRKRKRSYTEILKKTKAIQQKISKEDMIPLTAKVGRLKREERLLNK